MADEPEAMLPRFVELAMLMRFSRRQVESAYEEAVTDNQKAPE